MEFQHFLFEVFRSILGQRQISNYLMNLNSFPLYCFLTLKSERETILLDLLFLVTDLV